MWTMKKAAVCYIMFLAIWFMCNNKANTTQQNQPSWSVSWNELKGGKTVEGEAKTIVIADGAEYKLEVTGNIPSGVTFKWQVLPSGGILSGETGRSLMYQAPIAHEQKTTIKVTAVFPPGGEGGDEYWAQWNVAIQKPFVNVYLYENTPNDDEAYVLAQNPPSTQEVYGFIGATNLTTDAIKDVPVHWSETHKDGGEAGTLSANQTNTDEAGVAKVVLTTSTKAGDYHHVTATIKDKDGEESKSAVSPKINVFDVEIKEIWSDQLDGEKANYHPDGSGSDGGKNYLLIAPRSPYGDLKFKARINVTPDLPEIREKILVRLKDIEGNVEGVCSLSGDVATVSVPYDQYIGDGMGSTIVAGIDGNNELDILHVYDECSLYVVDRDKYVNSGNALYYISTVTWLAFPLASDFLLSFITGTQVGKANAYGSSDVYVNWMYHNVGVPFEGEGLGAKGPVRQNIFHVDNSLTNSILKSNAFRNCLYKVFNDNAGKVQGQGVYHWSLESSVIDYADDDDYFGMKLEYAFGKAMLTLPVVSVTVGSDHKIQQVHVLGQQTDRYDFDYNGPGISIGGLSFPLDMWGATVQAGYPTLNLSGDAPVFNSLVQFNHVIEDIDYTFN